MTYSQMAQLELMNAAANISSQEDLDSLRLTLSLFFAESAHAESAAVQKIIGLIDFMAFRVKVGGKPRSISQIL